MNNNVKKKITETIQANKKCIAELEADSIETIADAADAIIKALKQAGRVYLCGNGGSAADAQHIASELIGKFEHHRKALAATALTTDTSLLTSVSNDYGYEKVFVRQVEALVQKGDIFWAISTSGASANVIEAAELAKKKGACVLAFTGLKNSKLEEISDICFCSNNTSTARCQEAHQLAYHIICSIVEESFCKKTDG